MIFHEEMEQADNLFNPYRNRSQCSWRTVGAGVKAAGIFGLYRHVGTQLINAITTPTVLAYIEIGMLFAVISYFFAKWGIFKSLWKSALSGIAVALVAVCLAVPTTAFFLGGFAGTGATTIAAALMASGWGVLPATFVSEAVSEGTDKIVCLIIIFFVLKAIPDRLKVKLPNARFFIDEVED